MDCETARKLIPVFLDGELAESQPLEDHIAGCAGCSDELAAQTALMQALDTWQGVEPARSYADFRARVENRRCAESRKWWQPIHRLSPRWVAAGLVAVALLGGTASGLYSGTHVPMHSHVVTPEMKQVSESLDLESFSGGLSDVVIADAGEEAK